MDMKQFEQLAGKFLAGVQALPASASATSRCLRQSLYSRYWQLAQVILCMNPSLNVNAMKASNLERITGCIATAHDPIYFFSKSLMKGQPRASHCSFAK